MLVVDFDLTALGNTERATVDRLEFNGDGDGGGGKSLDVDFRKMNFGA